MDKIDDNFRVNEEGVFSLAPAVNNYDVLYKAWQDIGADFAGLSWTQFVAAIEIREKM